MKLSSALLLSQMAVGALSTHPKARTLRKNTRKVQESLVQVDEYDCSSKTTSFGSSVLLDFHKDVSMLDDTLIAEMQEGFIKTYSELVFALCDVPYFTTVADAEITVLAKEDFPTGRQFETDLFQETNLTHVLKVDVSAGCKECDYDTIFSGVGGESDMMDMMAMTSVTRKADETNKNNKYNTCICPAVEDDFVPSNRTPTEVEFYAAFSSVVSSVDDGSLSDSFDLFEAKSVNCNKKPSEYTTSVFVRIDGDLEALDEPDIVVMEEAIMATYNGLNFAYCDLSHFRTVTNVTLDAEATMTGGMRKLQDSAVNLDFSENVLLLDQPFDGSVLKFDVTFECRNCKSGAGLFSFDPAENHTVAEIMETLPPFDTILGRSNELQGDSGHCFCPAHTSPKHRSPTTKEFQAALSVTLAALEDAGSLSAVAELQDIVETVDVRCYTPTEFTSTVFVELDMPLSKLSDVEKGTIEDTFLQSYNSLAFSTCDKSFREVKEVSLVSASSRRGRALVEGNATMERTMAHNATDERFPAVFNVLGRCRNCKVDGSGYFELFDDTFDDHYRRLTSNEKLSSSVIFGSSVAPSFQGPSRQLMDYQYSQYRTCKCPSDADPSASPTTDSFIDVFNARIVELKENGILSDVPLVEDLVEAGDVCDGATFLAFLDRYELGLSGDADSVSDDVLTEAFRVAYNAQRAEDCDPLVVTAGVLQRNDDPTVTEHEGDLSWVRLMVDTLQLEMGDILKGEGALERFLAAFNAILESEGYAATLVTAMYDPSEAPSASPSAHPTKEPSAHPSRSPSAHPSSSPSAHPSKPPSIAPSMSPSVSPTLNRAMCNHQVTELTDYVVIDYSIARIGDIDLNLPWGMKMPEVWPLDEPATLIAAEEYIAAYNRLQSKVFCDPFRRRIATVSCVSTLNNILSGSLCCTVHFKCLGNCKTFIYPDRDPIGAFYDQPGFQYPTDESCVCELENSVLRAPSAKEHFDKINDNVPLEILSFDFRGYSTDKCPKY